MSLYAIHKFLCQLRKDEAFRRAAQADPQAALDALTLKNYFPRIRGEVAAPV